MRRTVFGLQLFVLACRSSDLAAPPAQDERPELETQVQTALPGLEDESPSSMNDSEAPVAADVQEVPAAADVDELVAALPEQLSEVNDIDALERWSAGVKLVPGVTDARRHAGAIQSVTITLADPIPTARVIELLGLKKPRGVSTDVHQRSWSIRLEIRRIADPHNRRIATEFPHVGPWDLILRLDGRPQGPLPGVVAGASSAYDLTRTPSSVTQIEIRRRPEGGG